MLVNTAPLLKILELEQQKNYADSAVIGGLDRFLRNWAGTAGASLQDSLSLSRFQNLVNTDYSDMGRRQRETWVKNMLAFLAEQEKEETRPAKAPAEAVPRLRSRTARLKSSTATAAGGLDSPVTVIRGISTALEGKFAKLGVRTVRDLLYFFPHRHLDYSQVKTIAQLTEGEQTIVANVWQAKVSFLGGRRGTEAIVGDETGNVRAVWFNQPYIARNLTTNSRIVLSGKVSLFRGRLVFQSPEWEPVESQDPVHTARLVPVYPLTQGLYPRTVRKLVKGAVDLYAGQVTDFLPAVVKERSGLLDLPAAIAQAHFPEDAALKDKARIRLAFDELFLLQLGVMSKKRDWQESQPGNPLEIDTALKEKFLKSLPFTLTAAQQKVLQEILADLQKPLPMCRLLQGDVGSGKTVVATAALLVAAANGFQGAFMAPTEILARQHFATISGLLARLGEPQGDDYLCRYTGILPRPLTLALLTGEITVSRKQELQQQIIAGEIDIVIGTHAIIQKEVAFKKLGLAVVDEQHRFGVEQRSALRQKGFNPHMLVMTATPIPRTLALTLYGDLDLSIINELPPGRQAIKTKWLQPGQRESAYAFLRKQIAAGHQAFIICPLIEESETITAQAAVTEYERLSQEVFPDLRLGLLHGKINAAEKDDVMRRFHDGAVDILVATPVVEVGIDIPNATVMLIESAERFGLSQLHQFRGRVGRGQAQSYCLLMAENPSEIGQQRLDIIEKVQDGFVLAEEDLKLRGPGEFFGTRQSGLPDLRMAKLSDTAILELARNEATRLFAEDPEMKRAEHKLLAKEMARVWPKNTGEWS
ncbi:MAG: ATP-dependent DNA helicase RecG [Dehalococcoidales bacterium]|nr:ATP-dependent DNA helicase RecG [Dehalococcoidales bacterium]